MSITPRIRKIAAVLFILYLLVASWVIMLKCNYAISIINSRWLMDSMTLEERVVWSFLEIHFDGDEGPFTQKSLTDVFLNVVVFIPFGLLLPFLFNKKPYHFSILYAFLLTLAFELTQFLICIGGFSYLDLFNNTLGGIIGVFIHRALIKHVKEKPLTIAIYSFDALLSVILIFALVNTLINIELYL